MKKRNAILMLLAFTVIRLMMSGIVDGYLGDIGFFRLWTEAITNRGITRIYDGSVFINYQPIFIYFLWFFGKCVKIFHIEAYSTAYIMLLKMPAIVADSGLAWLAYIACNRSRYAPIFMLIFCPAIAINSIFWGQMDSIFVFVLVSSLICLIRGKLEWAAILYAIATLTKPQSILFAPVFIYTWLDYRREWVRILLSIIYSMFTVFVVCLPVSPNGFNVWWIKDTIRGAIDSYTLICMNAYNVFFFLGMNLKEEISEYWKYYKIIMPIFTTLVGWCFWLKFKYRTQQKIFLLGFWIAFSVFVYMPEMHERYSFSALVCLYFAYACGRDRRFLYLIYGLSMTLFLNCLWILSKYKQGGGDWSMIGNFFDKNGVLWHIAKQGVLATESTVGVIVSLLNIFIWIYGTYVILQKSGEP